MPVIYILICLLSFRLIDFASWQSFTFTASFKLITNNQPVTMEGIYHYMVIVVFVISLLINFICKIQRKNIDMKNEAYQFDNFSKFFRLFIWSVISFIILTRYQLVNVFCVVNLLNLAGDNVMYLRNTLQIINASTTEQILFYFSVFVVVNLFSNSLFECLQNYSNQANINATDKLDINTKEVKILTR